MAVLAEAQLPGAGADGVDDALTGAGLPQVPPTDVAQPGLKGTVGTVGRNSGFFGDGLEGLEGVDIFLWNLADRLGTTLSFTLCNQLCHEQIDSTYTLHQVNP